MRTMKRIAMALCALAMAGGSQAAPKAQARATARAVAAIPRPEHPRPDFRRDLWLNLNGKWAFEIDELNDGTPATATRAPRAATTITVPFCPESKLSGLAHRDFMQHVWYRRTFTVPAAMRGKRLLLHFGAVDWKARVWLNGKLLGEHTGGYVPFAFEVTKVVKPGANEVVVKADDDTRSGLQATGKQAQSQESEGCVYTRTTGIWQTVWLEAAGPSYLRQMQLIPDLKGGRLVFRGLVDGAKAGTKVRLRALAGGTDAGAVTLPVNGRVANGALKLDRVVAWQPGKPFLYDLTATVERDGKALDTVHSYFGLRTVSIQGNRFLINGKPIFQRLVLDQGFYPAGIYTAPTDADLKRDVVMSMAAGFNGARLHQKVFEPRLLYWADRLGYMVWGEYPNWGLNYESRPARDAAVQEWTEAVVRDRNHPSIIGWCPLNETAGGKGVAELQQRFDTRGDLDPTRPYLDTSGWVHLFAGTDVYDTHDYDQNPQSFAAKYAGFGLTGQNPPGENKSDPRGKYRGQPYFISEYGGIHLRTSRDVGTKGWGYGQASLKEFLARYKGLTDVLLDNPNICGFCYTQLTDIEQEQNGIYFYDRTPKFNPALVKRINARTAAYETQPPRVLRVHWQTLVPSSRREAQTWRYTTARPEANWFKPGFNDRAWSSGPGGFGTAGTPGAVARTRWETKDIWLRRTFRLGGTASYKLAGLEIHHDEDAEVYVNGRKVATLGGYSTGYSTALAPDLAKALKPGENTLAVHCHQTMGGQYVDVGVVGSK